MDNILFSVEPTSKKWRWIFALVDFSKWEVIADWSTWTVYEVEKVSDLVPSIRDYAIQISYNQWIDYPGIGRNFNHSCDPNCWFDGKFKIVSMRDIKQWEELSFDYEMCERSDWRMKCLCGTNLCRWEIGSYDNMPDTIRTKYGRYISSWILSENNS